MTMSIASPSQPTPLATPTLNRPGTGPTLTQVAAPAAGGVTSTSPLSAPAVAAYPTTLPSLTSADFADLAARRRNATSGLQRALAHGEAATGRAGANYEFALSRLQDRFASERGTTLNTLAGRGLARQPRFAGKALRGLRDAEVGETSQLEVDKANQLAAIAAAGNEARGLRDAEIGQIEADEVRRRSELSRLISSIGA